MVSLDLTEWTTVMVARVRSARRAALRRLDDRGWQIELLSDWDDLA